MNHKYFYLEPIGSDLFLNCMYIDYVHSVFVDMKFKDRVVSSGELIKYLDELTKPINV